MFLVKPSIVPLEYSSVGNRGNRGNRGTMTLLSAPLDIDNIDEYLCQLLLPRILSVAQCSNNKKIHIKARLASYLRVYQTKCIFFIKYCDNVSIGKISIIIDE